MEPEVLEDIREIEKLHRKPKSDQVRLDVHRRYAELLRDGLASWTEFSCVYTDDVKAAEVFRNEGTWSDRLNGYAWLVIGDMGYGLFRDDGGPRTDHIDFWDFVDDELRQAVMKEAFLLATMFAANYSISSEELGGCRGGQVVAEVAEAFCEASHNALERVKEEAGPCNAKEIQERDKRVSDLYGKNMELDEKVKELEDRCAKAEIRWWWADWKPMAQDLEGLKREFVRCVTDLKGMADTVRDWCRVTSVKPEGVNIEGIKNEDLIIWVAGKYLWKKLPDGMREKICANKDHTMFSWENFKTTRKRLSKNQQYVNAPTRSKNDRHREGVPMAREVDGT